MELKLGHHQLKGTPEHRREEKHQDRKSANVSSPSEETRSTFRPENTS